MTNLLTGSRDDEMNTKILTDDPTQLMQDVVEFVKNQFSLAQRTDTVKEFLESIHYPLNDLIEASKKHKVAGKVLVIGESPLSKRDLQGLVDASRLSMYEFEYELNYEDILKFKFIPKLRKPSKYCAVLVGPMNHNQKGVGKYSSMISRMEAETDKFPRIVRIKDSNNKLKITKSGFDDALQILEEELGK